MTDTDRDTLPLQDEDRLPWLEAVDDEGADNGVSTAKLIGFAVAALVAIGIVIGGIALLRSQQPGPQGDGKLILAEKGDYKVKPDAPGGMAVEGQGDSAFAASEGAEANGKINLNGGPEAPVATTKTRDAKPGFSAGTAEPSVTAVMPASGGKLVAPPPVKASAAAATAAPSGSLVQLGAYNNEAQANQAWTMLAKRFAYLAPLSKSVEIAEVGGRRVYRLRANTNGQAQTVCGKLKVAGENCLIVN